MSGLRKYIPLFFLVLTSLVLLGSALTLVARAALPQASQWSGVERPALASSNAGKALTKFYLPLVQRSGTNVCGEITADTNWTSASSPYWVTCDVTVPTGVALTLDAGVVVQIDHYCNLVISGTLLAVGTPYAPIRLQPSSPGSWGRIAFMPGSAGVLDHAVLVDGGGSGGTVYIASDAVQVSDSVVQDSASTGIIIQAASPLISATQFLNNTGGGLYNDSGNPTILNNTFIENWDYGPGGGLYNQSGSPNIQNNTFSRNTAGSIDSHGAGGGIYTASGNPTIQNNTFSGNSAGTNLSMGSGGGLYIASGDPIIQNNTFTNNSIYNDYGIEIPGNGAGVYNESGSPIIQNNTFTGNSAINASGGGLYNDSGSPTIRNNVFSNNSAYVGGGLLTRDGSPMIENNVFSGNLATRENGGGGGLYIGVGDPIIQNNIFAGNAGSGLYNWWGNPIIQNNTFAGNSGGGIYSIDGRPVIRGNIVVNNTASQGGGIYDDPYHGATPPLDYNDVWNNTGGNYYGVIPGAHDLSSDPRLVDPASGDFHLAQDSPCIDAGDLDSNLEADFEGDPRPMGLAPDIGADEYRTLRVGKRAALEETSPGTTLTYTLTLANLMASPLTDVLLTDILPSATRFTSYQADGITCTHDGSAWGGQISCTPDSAFLAPGESRILTVVTILTDTLPAAQYVTNPVTMSANAGGETILAFDRARTWIAGCAVQLNDAPMGGDLQAAINASTQITDVVKVSGYCRVHNLSLNKTLILQGSWSSDFQQQDPKIYPTTLDGQGLGRVIDMYWDVDPTIDGFVITGGQSNYGGGLDNGSGSPIIQNNIFIGNTAYGDEGSGGGVCNNSGNPIIQNNIFIGNQAGWSGGGLKNEGGSPIIQNNIFAGNQADSGGGFYSESGDPILLNNTFDSNLAIYEGGGMSIRNGSPVILGNIVVNNTANSAGGIYSSSTFATPLLDYNDFWGNTPTDYEEIGPGTHDISADPLLVDPANGDFHLAPGSPCIDAGDPINYPATDFEGDPRPIGAAPDIGADEFRGFLTSPSRSPSPGRNVAQLREIASRFLVLFASFCAFRVHSPTRV